MEKDVIFPENLMVWWFISDFSRSRGFSHHFGLRAKIGPIFGGQFFKMSPETLISRLQIHPEIAI